MEVNQSYNSSFKSKVSLVYKVGIVILAASLIIFYTFNLFLLIFVGILIAIFFNGLGQYFSTKTRLSYKWSLLIVILILSLIIYISAYLMTPSLIEQSKELGESLPQSGKKVQEWFEGLGLGDKIQEMVAAEELRKGAKEFFTKATGVLSGIATGLIHALIFLLVGIYLAYSPKTYKSGFLKLFAKEKRSRIHNVMDEVGSTLHWWLIGRFIDMTFVGILTWLGLTFLGVPLALILAIIAATTNFIPNIGPFIGSVPAILIGLSIDPILALYIAILYTIIQSLESAFITPLVQQKAISLPPALTIIAQIILGSTYGTVGLLVATPLLATGIVLINRLYVNDVLHDENNNKGNDDD